jgi:hypothetical protein
MPPRNGSSLLLAAGLAVLSYLPFEYVARGSWCVCVYLFVVDPMPPMSRLLSLVLVLVIALLTRMHRQWHSVNDAAHDEVQVTFGKEDHDKNGNAISHEKIHQQQEEKDRERIRRKPITSNSTTSLSEKKEFRME